MTKEELILVVVGVMVFLAALPLLLWLVGALTVEERYGSTPWSERRLRLFRMITLWQWDE